MGTKVIYKYPLNPIGKNTQTLIRVPKGSHPVHFGKDPQEQLCIWIERPVTYEKLSSMQFMIVGTGIEFDNNDNGWVPFDSIIDGPFVWHCYIFKR